MRLEVGEKIGQCKLWVSPAEFEVLRQAAAEDRDYDLPEDVLEHLKSHGHYAPSKPEFGFAPYRPLFGLDVHIEE